MRRDKVDFSTGLLDIEATVVVAERERQIADQPPEKVAPRVGSGLQNVDHPPTVGGTTASESPTSSASQVPGTFTWRSRVDHRCLPFSTIYGRAVPAMGEVIPWSWTLVPSRPLRPRRCGHPDSAAQSRNGTAYASPPACPGDPPPAAARRPSSCIEAMRSCMRGSSMRLSRLRHSSPGQPELRSTHSRRIGVEGNGRARGVDLAGAVVSCYTGPPERSRRARQGRLLRPWHTCRSARDPVPRRSPRRPCRIPQHETLERRLVAPQQFLGTLSWGDAATARLILAVPTNLVLPDRLGTRGLSSLPTRFVGPDRRNHYAIRRLHSSPCQNGAIFAWPYWCGPPIVA